MHHDFVARVVYFAQRRRYAQPHAVRQINLNFLKFRIRLKLRALRLVFVVQHAVVPVHYVNVAVIVNRHAAQFLNYEIKIDVHADHAEEFAVQKHRRHVGNDVKFRHGVDVGLNPNRTAVAHWNVKPANVLRVVRRIRR